MKKDYLNPSFAVKCPSLLLVLALSACGGGGSGSSNTDTTDEPNAAASGDNTAPLIIEVSPSHESLDVNTQTPIHIQFNEDMLATSFEPSSFELTPLINEVLVTDNTITAQAQLDADTKGVTYTPAYPLGPLTKYQATLNTQVTDLAGNEINDAHSWQFVTADAQWQEPSLIAPSGEIYISYQHNIAQNKQGVQVAVWGEYTQATETTNATRYIAANTYSPDTGWQTATLLDSSDQDSTDPQIVALDNNQFLATWIQGEDLISSVYVVGNGWQPFKAVESIDDGEIREPILTLDHQGNPYIIWLVEKDSNDLHRIFSNRFDVNSGEWQQEELIVQHDDHLNSPRLGLDKHGNRLLVWYQINEGSWFITTKRYQATGNNQGQWLASQTLDKALRPQLAMNANGNAMITWNDNKSQNEHQDVVRVRYYNPEEDSWLDSEIISSADENTESFDPYVTLSDSGLATVVWSQEVGDEKRNLWIRNFSNRSWDTAQQVDNSGEADVYLGKIVNDAQGNGFITWTLPVEGGHEIYAARLHQGVLQTTQRLNPDSADTNRLGQSTIHLNSQGSASILWRNGGETWLREFK